MLSEAASRRSSFREALILHSKFLTRICWQWLMLLLLGAFTLQAMAAPTRRVHERAKPLVIAYLFPGNSVLHPDAIHTAKLSRINYAFANIQDGRMVNGFAKDDENFGILRELKQRTPALQILISVGGWAWSGNFSDMALTAASRKLFIDSAVDFIERNGFDGVDIDWEYPGLVGNGNVFRAQDRENYTALLREMRLRFDSQEKELHRRLYLSAAAGAQREFLEHTDVGRVARYLDTVNLMAYDYYEPGSDRTTGNHAPLYRDPRDPKRVSAAGSVRAFERLGVPAHKIVLGVPFYGHVWGHVPRARHGLFERGDAVPGVHANYDDITNSMLGRGYTRYWDSAAQVPYLYSEARRQFVSYEDPESLVRKCRFVREHGLGGIMFWDYAGDPSGALLDTIDSCLRGAPRVARPPHRPRQ